MHNIHIASELKRHLLPSMHSPSPNSVRADNPKEHSRNLFLNAAALLLNVFHVYFHSQARLQPLQDFDLKVPNQNHHAHNESQCL